MRYYSFYIFIIFQVLYEFVQSKQLQRVLSSQLDSSKNQICRENIFVTNFLQDSLINYKKIQADEIIQKSCPTLRETCCSEKAFQDLGQRFIVGLKQLYKLKKNLQVIHQNFELLSKINFQKLKDMWDSKVEKCNLKIFEESIYNKLLNYNEFENDFELLFDKLADHYAGFGCELCQYNNNEAFDVTRYFYSINVSYQQVEVFYDIVQLVGSVYKFYLELIEISELGYCVAKVKQKYLSTEKHALSFYDKLQERIERCRLSSIAHYDESCTLFVENIGFFDCFKFFNRKENILKELNVGLYLLGDFHSKDVKRIDRIYFFGKPFDENLFKKLTINYKIQQRYTWNQYHKPNFSHLKKLKSQISNDVVQQNNEDNVYEDHLNILKSIIILLLFFQQLILMEENSQQNTTYNYWKNRIYLNLKKSFYFEFYWSLIFYPIQLFQTILFYPNSTFSVELSMFIFVFLINFIKLQLGEQGSANKDKQKLILFLILTFPLFLSRFFAIFLQTYMQFKKIKI